MDTFFALISVRFSKPCCDWLFLTHQVRRCSLWAPASPSCGRGGTCVGAGVSVDVGVGGREGGGEEDEGEVRARVPTRSRGPAPPCEPPARTAGPCTPA